MSCNLFSSGEICGTWRSFFTGGAVAGGLEACAKWKVSSQRSQSEWSHERLPEASVVLPGLKEHGCRDVSLTPFFEPLEKRAFMIA
jgi:hypothetical protein